MMQLLTDRRIVAFFLMLGLAAAAVVGQVTTIQGEDPAGVRRIVATNTSGEIITAAGSGPSALSACDLHAPISSAGAGTTQIIAGVGGDVVYLCHVSLSWSSGSAVDWRIIRGTNANCAAGTANMTDDFENIDSILLDFGTGAALRTNAGDFVCFVQTNAGTAGGVVSYAIF